MTTGSASHPFPLGLLPNHSGNPGKTLLLRMRSEKTAAQLTEGQTELPPVRGERTSNISNGPAWGQPTAGPETRITRSLGRLSDGSAGAHSEMAVMLCVKTTRAEAFSWIAASGPVRHHPGSPPILRSIAGENGRQELGNRAFLDACTSQRITPVDVYSPAASSR